MSASLAELPPTAADLERELAAAKKIVAERPKSWLGVARPPGLTDEIYFTNLGYYTAYPAAALKIAKGDAAGAAAWKRIREHVLRVLLEQVPVSPNWNPALPTWPLPTEPREWSAGSDFGARRPWKKDRPQKRKHTGIDLKAAAGVPIVAPESGVVVAAESGWEMEKGEDGVWRGVKSLIMVTDSGFTVLLGGTRPGSAKVKNGERVTAGQPVAVVGNYPLGDSMLHFQLYGRPLTEFEVNQRKKWPMEKAPPADLVNPREYLEAAALNPKVGVVGVVPGNQTPDEGALVENDVEAGEVNEGTAEGDAGDEKPISDEKPAGEKSNGAMVALAVGGVVVLVGGVAAALWASNQKKRPGRRAA